MFVLIFTCVFFVQNAFAQSQTSITALGDAQAAQRYVSWVKQAIAEGRYAEALAGLERASDFANVSSDISYLLAVVSFRKGKSRRYAIDALDKALEINRWVDYNESHALLLKAEHLIAMRRYTSAIFCLDRIAVSIPAALSADAVMQRLLAFRGLAINPFAAEGYDPAQALVGFRSLMVSAMDRFPRDPRPLEIFFGYARNKKPDPLGDFDLLELVLRRLPFLLDVNSELAWMAAPFVRDVNEARRLTASYRAGGIPNVQNRDFKPSMNSIPVALNLGLLDDNAATDELFSGTRGFNSPLPPGITANGNPVLEMGVITEVYALLRSEEGREYFTQRLHAFTGTIIHDYDNDGFFDSQSLYRDGSIRGFALDRNQENSFDFSLSFSVDGAPQEAGIPVIGHDAVAKVQWEKYPSVMRIILAGETFSFRPADFQFAPVEFIMIGGSRRITGLAYPAYAQNHTELTRRSMLSFCASLSRPSVEFDGAVELIFFENALPKQAVETLNGKQVSVTEFERGVPVIQYIDLDLDGRMETIRRFHGANFQPPETGREFDFRAFIASSESDWSGDGRFKTGEVYSEDGSVVYSWDMDGSGVMNYYETEN
ncbi:MAG: tetratricopeptide repeat protein [Treponema sp.]|nr:tetratricopeptide repeat protein [Treponema sp.]